MGLIKKIKKISIIAIMLSMMSVTLSGCVYANNKNWSDMTAQEKQEVKEQYQEVKEELEQEFAGDDFEDKLGTFFLNVVGEELDNLE